MKKPLLKSFSNEVLILLSRQKNDKEFDEEVRSILAERYINSTLPYIKVYLNYRNSEGVEKLAYGDTLATHLIEGGYSIEGEVLDELLPNLSIEHIWALSKSSDSFVREKSREHLFSVLDLYEKEVVTVKRSKQKKFKRENVIYFKRKGE